jgi:hypothetical protein
MTKSENHHTGENPRKRQRTETIDLDINDDSSSDSLDVDSASQQQPQVVVPIDTSSFYQHQAVLIQRVDLLVSYQQSKLRSHLVMLTSPEQLRQHVMTLFQVPEQYRNTVKLEYFDPLFNCFLRLTTLEFLDAVSQLKLNMTSGDPNPPRYTIRIDISNLLGTEQTQPQPQQQPQQPLQQQSAQPQQQPTVTIQQPSVQPQIQTPVAPPQQTIQPVVAQQPNGVQRQNTVSPPPQIPPLSAQSTIPPQQSAVPPPPPTRTATPPSPLQIPQPIIPPQQQAPVTPSTPPVTPPQQQPAQQQQQPQLSPLTPDPFRQLFQQPRQSPQVSTSANQPQQSVTPQKQQPQPAQQTPPQQQQRLQQTPPQQQPQQQQQQQKQSPRAAPLQPGEVMLKFHMNDEKPVALKARTSTALFSNMIKAFCKNKKIQNENSVKFMFDGRSLDPTKTLAQLGLTSEDTIDVFGI